MSAVVPRDETLNTRADEALVRRAQEGETQAANELFSRYQDKAYAIAYSLCSGHAQEAQDVVQDAFLKAFKNLKGYKGQASFYTWFYRIVVNTYLDAAKRRTRWARLFPFSRREATEARVGGRQPDPLTLYSGNALQQDVDQAMRLLPVMQRLVFQLKVLEGMSIAEIAEVTGTAEGTVKSHLFRATHALRTALKDWATP